MTRMILRTALRFASRSTAVTRPAMSKHAGRPPTAGAVPQLVRTVGVACLSSRSPGPPRSRGGGPPPPPPSRGPGQGGPAGGQPPRRPAPKPLAPGVTIVEVSEDNFESITRSPVPVILDCYASWCEPCKKLTPLLEAEVNKHKGRVILAKLNTDNFQEIAMQLQVRSLPTVFGIAQGKLVDMFVGLPDEKALSTFMEKLLNLSPVSAAGEQHKEPAGPEAEVAEADQLLKENKASEAGAIYKRTYEQLGKESSPSTLLQARCLAGLARCALVSGARSEAQQLVDALKSSHQAEIKSVPDVASALAFVELGLSAPADEEGVSSADTVMKLEEAVKANPADLEARHGLALKLFQLQRFEEAINQELEILKRDRAWNGGAANQLLLKIIEALGPGNELAKKARARMTNLLFR